MVKWSKIALSIIFIFILILSISTISAHAEDEAESSTLSLVEILESASLYSVGFAAILVIIFSAFAVSYKKKSKLGKLIIFLGIAIPVIVATVFIIGTTIYKESVSVTKGPVHWHADFEIWDCENFIDLKDPSGLLNRIGTPLYHEHADNRLHIEGTVIDIKDTDLDIFFEIIGGSLTVNKMVAPTNEGIFERENGETCNGNPGVWQMFVYKTIDGVAVQEKVEDFPSYIISPESYVPPGDCLILEFGPEKENTEHICVTYRVAIEQGDIIGS